MKLRTLAALALATSAVSFAAPAFAADTTGLRMEFGGSIATSSDFLTNNPNGVGNAGDIRIGYDFAGGFTPLLGLSYRTTSRNQYDSDDKAQSGKGFTDIVLNLEGRYYFRPHKKGISPFVFGGFDWHNVSVGSSDAPNETTNDGTEARDSVEGDRLSSLGFNAGFGLEWLASKSFGVGGKWGLDLNFAPTSIQEKGAVKAGSNTKNTTFGTAAAFYLAWRF